MILTNRTVLLVEDSPNLSTLLAKTFTAWGAKVVTAATGAEAMQQLDHHRPDIAVVDLCIPAPNGIEVLSRLTRLAPGSVRILISGALQLETAIAAINRGEVSRVVAKPFSIAELKDEIAGALEYQEALGDRLLKDRDHHHDRDRQAIDACLNNNLLDLALQPILRASDHSLFGYECLLRCSHGSIQGPQDLLAVADRLDMIPLVTSRVAQMAARRLDIIAPGTRLFVNLHAVDLADPQALLSRLQPLRSRSSRVVLEITEQADTRQLDRWVDSVKALREAGFTLAVDDLGAGYSSLSTLAEIQPHIVKVDMSIVRDVDRVARKQRLFELICQFARATDCQVVAEGVETPAEVSTVTQAGADLLQGYLFGKPSLEIPAAHKKEPRRDHTRAA